MEVFLGSLCQTYWLFTHSLIVETYRVMEEKHGSQGRKDLHHHFITIDWKEVSASCHGFSHLMKVERWKFISVFL